MLPLRIVAIKKNMIANASQIMAQGLICAVRSDCDNKFNNNTRYTGDSFFLMYWLPPSQASNSECHLLSHLLRYS